MRCGDLSARAFLHREYPALDARRFAAGADIVELDVHPTTDGHFAVFHDWTLDCRTDGHGGTREHSLAELKKLDIGHGYTADGGRPFRSAARVSACCPRSTRCSATFPTSASSSTSRATIPTKAGGSPRLKSLPPQQLQRLMVYGGALPVAAARQLLNIPTMSGAAEALPDPLFPLGWSGYVPSDCERSVLLVPVNYAPWLWGWPDRFLNRMNVMARLSSSLAVTTARISPAESIDPDDLALLPVGFAGGIWTNRIDRIAPLLPKR